MSVVEQATVPDWMVPSWPSMEVAVISAIKLVQTIRDVLGSMAVHDVKQDADAKTVGSVDHEHEFFGGTKTAANREETGDLVAKRRIVRVLHDRHQLGVY